MLPLGVFTDIGMHASIWYCHARLQAIVPDTCVPDFPETDLIPKLQKSFPASSRCRIMRARSWLHHTAAVSAAATCKLYSSIPINLLKEELPCQSEQLVCVILFHSEALHTHSYGQKAASAAKHQPKQACRCMMICSPRLCVLQRKQRKRPASYTLHLGLALIMRRES